MSVTNPFQFLNILDFSLIVEAYNICSVTRVNQIFFCLFFDVYHQNNMVYTILPCMLGASWIRVSSKLAWRLNSVLMLGTLIPLLFSISSS